MILISSVLLNIPANHWETVAGTTDRYQWFLGEMQIQYKIDGNMLVYKQTTDNVCSQQGDLFR